MIIKKVLNNNLLLVESENGKEQIAMGKGLRFSYKVGERLRETDVEKIYMLKDEKNTDKRPNIIFIQLESFFDVGYEKNLNFQKIRCRYFIACRKNIVQV